MLPDPFKPWFEMLPHPGTYDSWTECGTYPGEDELEYLGLTDCYGGVDNSLRFHTWRRKYNPPSEAAKLWAQRC